MAVGDTEAGGLTALAVDLEQLAEVLDGSPGEGEGRLDRRTGEVWPAVAIDYASDQTGEAVDFDDPNQWLAVPPEGPTPPTET